MGLQVLVVKNFPPSWSEPDLLQLFKDFAPLRSYIGANKKRRKKAVAFVIFSSLSQKRAALAAVNGCTVAVDAVVEVALLKKGSSEAFHFHATLEAVLAPLDSNEAEDWFQYLSEVISARGGAVVSSLFSSNEVKVARGNSKLKTKYTFCV